MQYGGKVTTSVASSNQPPQADFFQPSILVSGSLRDAARFPNKRAHVLSCVETRTIIEAISLSLVIWRRGYLTLTSSRARGTATLAGLLTLIPQL
jgi:hypothetical protein